FPEYPKSPYLRGARQFSSTAFRQLNDENLRSNSHCALCAKKMPFRSKIVHLKGRPFVGVTQK
ncbi:hypothetical protein NS907_27800, partial [Pseudomonas aeruginosa]|uniref:hypothetical protein n=1 Tax=Pseudomonas aeruginosa TaxID=287 RepID=UPI001E652161